MFYSLASAVHFFKACARFSVVCREYDYGHSGNSVRSAFQVNDGSSRIKCITKLIRPAASVIHIILSGLDSTCKCNYFIKQQRGISWSAINFCFRVLNQTLHNERRHKYSWLYTDRETRRPLCSNGTKLRLPSHLWWIRQLSHSDCGIDGLLQWHDFQLRHHTKPNVCPIHIRLINRLSGLHCILHNRFLTALLDSSIRLIIERLLYEYRR